MFPCESDFRKICYNTGVCPYPEYKDCKIKPAIFNPHTGMRWDKSPGYKKPKNFIDVQDEEEGIIFDEVVTIIKRPANLKEIRDIFENR